MFLFYFSCINCESINESGERFAVVDSFLCLNCRSLRQNLKTTQALAILQTVYTSDFLIFSLKRPIYLTSLYVYPNHIYTSLPYIYTPVTYTPHFLIYKPELYIYPTSLYVYPSYLYTCPPYIFGLSIYMNSLYYLAFIRSW